MLSVKDNVAEVLAWTDRLSRQYRFAVASALTDTVRQIAQVMPREVDQASEGGAVRFTQQAFAWDRADKQGPLVAAVRVKPQQAEYLRFMIEGGTRAPKRKALRLPGDIALTPQGNLPSGAIRRLIAQAKTGRGLTATGARRIGAARGATVMYGTPEGRRTPGLYLRTPGEGGAAGALTQLVAFPSASARYQAGTFDFYGIARREALARFTPALRLAWARAKATAR